jgi:hypothetical protein
MQGRRQFLAEVPRHAHDTEESLVCDSSFCAGCMFQPRNFACPVYTVGPVRAIPVLRAPANRA